MPASPALIDDWLNWRFLSLATRQTRGMPRKPPPVEIEVVYNEDPESARAAQKKTLKLLIQYILEDRAAGTPHSLTSIPKT